MSQQDPKTTHLRVCATLNPHPERVSAPAFQAGTFFDPRDLLQVKYEMLRLVHTQGASKSDAATLLGMSRPTYYQVEAAYAPRWSGRSCCLVGGDPKEPTSSMLKYWHSSRLTWPNTAPPAHAN